MFGYIPTSLGDSSTGSQKNEDHDEFDQMSEMEEGNIAIILFPFEQEGGEANHHQQEEDDNISIPSMVVIEQTSDNDNNDEDEEEEEAQQQQQQQQQRIQPTVATTMISSTFPSVILSASSSDSSSSSCCIPAEPLQQQSSKGKEGQEEHNYGSLLNEKSTNKENDKIPSINSYENNPSHHVRFQEEEKYLNTTLEIQGGNHQTMEMDHYQRQQQDSINYVVVDGDHDDDGLQERDLIYRGDDVVVGVCRPDGSLVERRTRPATFQDRLFACSIFWLWALLTISILVGALGVLYFILFWAFRYNLVLGFSCIFVVCCVCTCVPDPKPPGRSILANARTPLRGGGGRQRRRRSSGRGGNGGGSRNVFCNSGASITSSSIGSRRLSADHFWDYSDDSTDGSLPMSTPPLVIPSPTKLSNTGKSISPPMAAIRSSYYGATSTTSTSSSKLSSRPKYDNYPPTTPREFFFPLQVGA